jgi:hypothetical protein
MNYRRPTCRGERQAPTETKKAEPGAWRVWARRYGLGKCPACGQWMALHKGAERVYLTFEELRESWTIADKRTGVRMSIPIGVARDFYQLLGTMVTEVPFRQSAASVLLTVPGAFPRAACASRRCFIFLWEVPRAFHPACPDTWAAQTGF